MTLQGALDPVDLHEVQADFDSGEHEADYRLAISRLERPLRYSAYDSLSQHSGRL